ncbi:MAG: hypothetical protein N3D17_05400 [bacterium]|nr:hypothetical protein [bacterium]
MDKKKIILIILFLSLLEIRFIYIPARNKVVSLNKLITAKQKDKETLLKLCEEYKEKGEGEEPLRITDEEFSLLSYTGNLIESKNLERNITGLQPLRTEEKGNFKIESIRMGMKGITLSQLYEFLYDIEKAKYGIYIPDFRMQKQKDSPHLLDIEIELLVVKEAENSK